MDQHDLPKALDFNAVALEEFESLLKKELQIEMDHENPIAKAWETFEKVGEVHRGESRFNLEEHRRFGFDVSTALGVVSLAELVLELRDTEFIQKAIGHLTFFGNKDVVAAQNVQASLHKDPGTRKLFELLLGAAAFKAFGNVELEDPHDGRPSRNPDVITEADGVRWGIACKTLNSKSAQSLLGLIKGAFRQITNAVTKSGVQRGLIAINPAYILPYEVLIPHATPGNALVRNVFDQGANVMETVVHPLIWKQIAAAAEAAGDGWSEILPAKDAELDALAAMVFLQVAIVVEAPQARREKAWQFGR